MGIKASALEEWFKKPENRRVVESKMKEAMKLENRHLRVPGKNLLHNTRDNVLLQYRSDEYVYRFQLVTLEDSGVRIIVNSGIYWELKAPVEPVQEQQQIAVKGKKKK